MATTVMVGLGGGCRCRGAVRFRPPSGVTSLTCQLVIEGSLVNTSRRYARIDVAAAATLNDGVKDRAALASVGMAEEQPVLLADGGRSNGIFHEVVVELEATIFEIDTQKRPIGKRVIDGLAKSAARQIAA
jgi:hypothetical protein